MIRALLAVVGIAALVIIVLAALGFFGPTNTSQPAPSATRTAARSASATASASSRTTVTLTITEQQLTDAASASMPMTVSGITVTDPNVRLASGRATLTATGHAFFVSGTIVVVATPVVTNGEAAARVESATFAGRDEAGHRRHVHSNAALEHPGRRPRDVDHRERRYARRRGGSSVIARELR